jgi:plasmid stabilization system protein ParE
MIPFWVPLEECGVSNAEPNDLEDLMEYLARTTRLERREAERLIDEVLSFLAEQPETFVRRRHLELQRQGLANEAIFARLEQELARRRFAAPAYTRRQLRRIVYG